MFVCGGATAVHTYQCINAHRAFADSHICFPLNFNYVRPRKSDRGDLRPKSVPINERNTLARAVVSPTAGDQRAIRFLGLILTAKSK